MDVRRENKYGHISRISDRRSKKGQRKERAELTAIPPIIRPYHVGTA